MISPVDLLRSLPELRAAVLDELRPAGRLAELRPDRLAWRCVPGAPPWTYAVVYQGDVIGTVSSDDPRHGWSVHGPDFTIVGCLTVRRAARRLLDSHLHAQLRGAPTPRVDHERRTGQTAP